MPNAAHIRSFMNFIAASAQNASIDRNDSNSTLGGSIFLGMFGFGWMISISTSIAAAFWAGVIFMRLA